MADVTGPGIRIPILADATQFVKGFDKALAKMKAGAQKIQKYGKWIAAAGAAITAAFAIAVKKAIAFGTSIDRMAESTGIAHEQISKLAFAVSQYHGSQEALQKSTKRLAYAMSEAKDGATEYKDEFDKLGITVVDSSGKLRSLDDVFYELSGKLSILDDDTQALAIAQKILGRSGEELLPVMKQGEAALRESGDMAERLGLVLDAKTSKALESLGTTLGQIKSALLGVALNAVKPLVGDLEDMAVKVRDVIASLTTWMREHPQWTKKIVALSVGFGALATVFGTLIMLAPQLVASMVLVKGAFVGLSSPVGLVTVAVVALLAVVYEFPKVLERFGNSLMYAVIRPLELILKLLESIFQARDELLGGRIFGESPMTKQLRALREDIELTRKALDAAFYEEEPWPWQGFIGEKFKGLMGEAGEAFKEAMKDTTKTVADAMEAAEEGLPGLGKEPEKVPGAPRRPRGEPGLPGTAVPRFPITPQGFAGAIASRIGQLAEQFARERKIPVVPKFEEIAINKIISRASQVAIAQLLPEIANAATTFEAERQHLREKGYPIGKEPWGQNFYQYITANFKDIDLKEIAGKIKELLGESTQEAMAMVGD